MARLGQIMITLAIASTIVSTLSVYPHQLAYFNETAGGPENGHNHLLHSNLDWGQSTQLTVEKQRGLGLKTLYIANQRGSIQPGLACGYSLTDLADNIKTSDENLALIVSMSWAKQHYHSIGELSQDLNCLRPEARVFSHVSETSWVIQIFPTRNSKRKNLL